MFEQTLAVPVRANRACATMLGFATQSLLVTAALTIPILFPDSLPRVQTVINLFTPLAPPPPPPPGRTQAPSTKVRPLQVRQGILTAPATMPAKPMMIDEPPLTEAEMGAGTGRTGGVVGGMDNGVPNGVPFSIGQSIATPKPPAAAPKTEPIAAVKAPPAVNAPVRVGGSVQEAKLVHKVIPTYPLLAKQARISGVVQLSGWIAVDGRIRELKVLSGHPLLVPAAVDAVSKWVYQPTHLNGEPVEVIAPISVHFILN